MEKEFIVQIPEETSLNVERLFYEHKAGMQSVSFLMKDNEIRWDVLQNYVNVVETRYAELEMLKESVSREYLPELIRVSKKPYSYEFLFDRCAISYTVTEG